MRSKKISIPVRTDGFEFPKGSGALPPEFRRVMEFQDIEHRRDKWDETVCKLLTFLREKSRHWRAR